MVTTRVHDDLDRARSSRRAFVLGQVRGLRPLEFVTFTAPPREGFAYVEVSRDEHDDISSAAIVSERDVVRALALAPSPTRSGSPM